MHSRIEINEGDKVCCIYRGNERILRIHIGESLETIKSFSQSSTVFVVDFTSAVLIITRHSKNSHFEYFDFVWREKKEKTVRYLKDSIDFNDSFWFGGPQVNAMTWPIPKTTHEFAPYVTGDVFKTAINGYEPYWLSSRKVSIHVHDRKVALWTQHKDGFLNLQALPYETPYEGIKRNSDLLFNYRVYIGSLDSSLKDFYMHHKTFLFQTPSVTLSAAKMAKPIWTTWARYKVDVCEDDILRFLNEAESNRFVISQLELDDKWCTEYGDFKFDSNKFGRISMIAEQLRSKSIELTLWMHPFVSPASVNGKDVTLQQYFVKDAFGEVAMTRWWHGATYIVDFTNPEAREWFGLQLKHLKELGIHAFKFDAGEVSYLPRNFVLHSGCSPNDFSKAYVEFAVNNNLASEVRTASRTQEASILLRTMDRLSTWHDCGIRTILPILFNYSICGYNLNLPDMIGGNAYNNSKCPKELFIRWVQLNTFLVSMQFSTTPWDYDAETVQICRKMLGLRKHYEEYLIKTFEAVTRGDVPIRPLWWEFESDEAFMCNDQFFVGGELLVAPVLYENQRSRVVLLPEGCWLDHNGATLEGGRSVTVDAPLDVLPHFRKLS